MSEEKTQKEVPTAPHSIEAEESVICLGLLYPGHMAEAFSLLRAEDFFIVRNAWIWDAMQNLNSRGVQFGNEQVAAELQAQGRLEDIGGEAYLTYLVNHTFPSDYLRGATGIQIGNFAALLCAIVRETAVKRTCLMLASELAQLGIGDIDEGAFLSSEGVQAFLRIAEHMGIAARVNSMDVRAALKTMPYKEYLKTHHWQEMRRLKLFEANYACQVCGVSSEHAQLHVHHNTYERRGEEWLTDLTVLCADCHSRYHGVGKYARGKNGAKKQEVA